ncbi:MAG: FAD-dependent oxidoreductase [Eubacterium sp.]
MLRTSIDRKNKTVKVGKKSYPYDKLCLATGSKPFVPPMENVEGKENAVTFLDLASAKSLNLLQMKIQKLLSSAAA